MLMYTFSCYFWLYNFERISNVLALHNKGQYHYDVLLFELFCLFIAILLRLQLYFIIFSSLPWNLQLCWSHFNTVDPTNFQSHSYFLNHIFYSLYPVFLMNFFIHAFWWFFQFWDMNIKQGQFTMTTQDYFHIFC